MNSGRDRAFDKVRRLFEAILPEDLAGAMIGDIEEEYAQSRRGRAWLWRQVALALLHSLRLERPCIRLGKGDGTMQVILQDIRYAARMMMKRPGFTWIAILTLTLSVALNTVIFSVVNAVLVRPLPYMQPESILTVWQNNTDEAIPKDDVSPANFIDWRDRNSTFDRLAAIRPWEIEFQKEAGSQIVKGSLVSAGYFEIMGVRPILGRTLAADEFERSAPPSIVISHGLWQRMFGGDPGAIGRSVRTADGDVTVVGVMPPDFNHPAMNRETWGPLVITEGFARQRASTYLNVVGRPKESVTIDQARSDMERIASQLSQEFPRENQGVGITIIPLPDHIVDDAVRRPLLILSFSVALLFIAACLNLANLMLVNGSQRSLEFAVRNVLGAGRGRLLRQLLVEAVALSALGTGLGFLGAKQALQFVPGLNPGTFPRLDEVSIDINVMMFTFCLGVVAAAALGGATVAQMFSAGCSPAIHAGFGVAGASIGKRLRQSIVVAQVALAFVLLTGAGLLTRSFINLLSEDPGFLRENVLAIELHIWDRFPAPEQQTQFFLDLMERAAGRPGVQAVGAASALPFIGEGSIEIDTAYQANADGDHSALPQAFLTMVTPDYFRAMGIPLMEGRVFTDHDGPDRAPVALITEGLARRHWQNESPVGKPIKVRDDDRNPEGDQMVEMEVVGVVGDVVHSSLTAERRDEIFVPLQQRPFGSMMLVVRASSDPSQIVESIRSEIFTLNPLQSLGTTASIQQLIGRTLVAPRFYVVLIGVFAVTALILAIVGIYGVISLSTVQRTREIGVRISLGAVSGDILALVLRQGLLIVVFGISLGFVIAFAVSRFLDSLLFKVTPTDAVTYLGVSALLFVVAAIACYLPARRAARVDPVTALRFE
jgi:putative ABC transport system permease protein